MLKSQVGPAVEVQASDLSVPGPGARKIRHSKLAGATRGTISERKQK